MRPPAIPLDHDMMDRDHQRIEALMAAASVTPDDGIADLHADRARELAEHFRREEYMLRTEGFPGLHCHVAQHNILKFELDRLRVLSPALLRRALETSAPQLILSHIGTMDRMAAAWLRGELTDADFDDLRLAEPRP